MIIAGALVTGTGEEIRGFDPASNAAVEPGYRHGDAGHVDSACAAAAEAFPGYRATTSEQRARIPRGDCRQPRSHQGAPCRACRARVRPSGGTHRRRSRTHRRTASPVRRGVARGQLDRRADRPGAARPDPVAPARHPPARRAAGPRGRIRRQQLPARILGGGRRHRVRSGRRLPGGGQGARRTPRHVRTGRPRRQCRRRGFWTTRGHVLDVVRSRPWTRHRTGHRSADQGRRFHRITLRRNGFGRRRCCPHRAHPRLRRDEFDQPGLPARRSACRTRRRSRPRVRRIADDGFGPVLHEPRARHRRRRAGTRHLPRGRQGRDGRAPSRRRC